MAIRDLVNQLVQAKPANITLALAAVIGATLFVYWPGLDSPFLFDDIVNLRTMGDNQALNTYDRLIQFVFSGVSGPTGRPISLVSMLINDYAWPTEPWSFTYTASMGF